MKLKQCKNFKNLLKIGEDRYSCKIYKTILDYIDECYFGDLNG